MTRLACFVALALAGCAVQPVADDQLQWTPSYRYLDPTYLKPAPQTGEVVVMTGSHLICDMRLYVNGHGAVNFYDNEKVMLFLPAGEHRLTAQPRSFCRDMGNESTAAVTVNIVPGQAPQRFHIHMDADGAVEIVR